MQFLLINKANPFAEDDENKNAIQIAAKNQIFKTVSLLREKDEKTDVNSIILENIESYVESGNISKLQDVLNILPIIFKTLIENHSDLLLTKAATARRSRRKIRNGWGI